MRSPLLSCSSLLLVLVASLLLGRSTCFTIHRSRGLSRSSVQRRKSEAAAAARPLRMVVDAAVVDSAVAAVAATPYVPSPMDTSMIVRQLAVIAASAGSFYFWWAVLVPAKRTELSKDKRDRGEGSLGGYLQELRDADKAVAAAALASQFKSPEEELVVRAEGSGEGEVAVAVPVAVQDARTFERWLLRDWLSEQSQQKAAALPFLPKAKFNSGDNPILVATGLIMVTGVVSSLLGF